MLVPANYYPRRKPKVVSTISGEVFIITEQVKKNRWTMPSQLVPVNYYPRRKPKVVSTISFILGFLGNQAEKHAG